MSWNLVQYEMELHQLTYFHFFFFHIVNDIIVPSFARVVIPARILLGDNRISLN